MFLKPVYEKTVEMMTELNSEMHKLRETIIAEKLSSLTLSSMVRQLFSVLYDTCMTLKQCFNSEESVVYTVAVWSEQAANR
jgi:hypothetical protein